MEAYGGFLSHGGIPIAGWSVWFRTEKPTKLDEDWGYPYFRKPPYIPGERTRIKQSLSRWHLKKSHITAEILVRRWAWGFWVRNSVNCSDSQMVPIDLCLWLPLRLSMCLHWESGRNWDLRSAPWPFGAVDAVVEATRGHLPVLRMLRMLRMLRAPCCVFHVFHLPRWRRRRSPRSQRHDHPIHGCFKILYWQRLTRISMWT